MVVLLSSLALAFSPPEAWYVLGGPASCDVAVFVGEDGVPVGARAESCSAALEPALRAEAMGRRFPAGEERAVEIRIDVKPPQYAPKPWSDGTCLVAWSDGWLSKPDPRCDLPSAARTSLPPPKPGRRPWCALAAEVRDGALTVRRDGCGDDWPDAITSDVARWGFPLDTDRTWRILVGAPAADAGPGAAG